MKTSRGERHAGARLERIGWVAEDHLKGESHALSVSGFGRVKLLPTEGSRCNPMALFVDFTGVRTINDRKGEWRDHSGKVEGALTHPLTTEKMLSANRILSNIFLQTGQNIEIADKKWDFSFPNFGSWKGLAFY